MAIEREARPMAEIFKFQKIGAAVSGKITDFTKTQHGYLAVLTPALIRMDRKADFQRFGNIAIGLSTDLKYKIDVDNDKGKYITLIFDSTEPTTKGSSKKVFRVLEITKAEFDKIEFVEPASGEKAPTQPLPSEGDDDLPF